MGIMTLIGLAILLFIIAFIMIYFLREAFDSSDSSRIDKLPDGESYLNDRDSTHDRSL
ncbi:hypothetical protein [Bacillus aerolatus]|uniref:hypothetical protein n=1 Tax=Bacillus aerolatus TaxID=2653354 RepID=UPI0017806A34|nr:hypothetical protein [Bacillus aerolatus]